MLRSSQLQLHTTHTAYSHGRDLLRSTLPRSPSRCRICCFLCIAHLLRPLVSSIQHLCSVYIMYIWHLAFVLLASIPHATWRSGACVSCILQYADRYIISYIISPALSKTNPNPAGCSWLESRISAKFNLSSRADEDKACFFFF